MIRVSAAEFQRNFGRYSDLALREPVAVTRNGRERTVTMSIEEYHKMRQGYRRVMRLEDFTEEDIKAIEESRAPEWTKVYDNEVE